MAISRAVYNEMLALLKEARERIHNDALEEDGEAPTPLICKRIDELIKVAETWEA